MTYSTARREIVDGGGGGGDEDEFSTWTLEEVSSRDRPERLCRGVDWREAAATGGKETSILCRSQKPRPVKRAEHGVAISPPDHQLTCKDFHGATSLRLTAVPRTCEKMSAREDGGGYYWSTGLLMVY